MATNRIGTGIGQFVLALRAHEALGQTDGQLLRRFLNQHDEAAFAALVQRHGTMVFGVCRRILGNAADAEDAFQATFLVLVRKARSLQSRAVVGDWLHGVARRTALKAKGAAARRRRKEQAMARPEALGDEARDDWLPLLDEELSGLPEKYRLPIVLCDLEGRTRQEVAKHLGWPEGTVAGRLARARAMLAQRLVRRGVILPAGALTVLPTNAASAHVPAAVVSNTIKAATLLAVGETAAEGVISAKVAILTGEVMKAMLLNKLTTPALLFAVCVLGGFGWVGYSSLTNEVAGAVQGVDTNVAARQDQNADKEPIPEGARQEKVSEAPTNIGPKLGVNRPSARHLLDSLMEPIDMNNFQNQMTLKDALGLFYDTFRVKGREITILVSNDAFKEENPDAPIDIYETPLRFPPYPKIMTLATALKVALSQIAEGNAELLIYDGYIEITTKKRASLPYLLQQKVFAHFENRPFIDVVRDLTDMTGLSINLDPRVEEKAKTKINASFRNDVTLEGALRIVTDMAGLKMVDMKSGLYITTPANAKELEKELRDLQRAPVKDKTKKDENA